jgi:hypothetical protein
VSLHNQTGQKEDIAGYVRSIVFSDSDTNMKRWKKEDKELVVKTLAERADGMYADYFMSVYTCLNVEQVPLGVLPVGNPTGLSPVERSAFS